MGLFSKQAEDPRVTALSEQISSLTTAVAGLQGLKDHLSEANTYGEEITKLHKEKALLETEISKQKEDHEREMREIEHKVGLHKTQVEAEIALAKKEAETEGKLAVQQAKLEVETSNLAAERQRFEDELKFRTERFEQEAATIKDMAKQVLDRLPKFDKQHVTHEYIGTPPGDAPKQIEA